MAKQKKLNGNKSSDKKSDRKDSRNANSKKAGTVIAVFLALVLIASSAAVVTYLADRGKRAMSDYSGSSVETTVPEEATVHKVIEKAAVPDCVTQSGTAAFLGGMYMK